MSESTDDTTPLRVERERVVRLHMEAENVHDFDDVIARIAPRPCLIVSPQRNRNADFNDVLACVNRSRRAWVKQGNADGLQHLTPNDIDRFQKDQHAMFTAWCSGLQ